MNRSYGNAGIDKCIKTPLLIQTDTSFEVSEYTLRSVHAFATVHCVNIYMGHTVWHGQTHILHITTPSNTYTQYFEVSMEIMGAGAVK